MCTLYGNESHYVRNGQTMALTSLVIEEPEYGLDMVQSHD